MWHIRWVIGTYSEPNRDHAMPTAAVYIFRVFRWQFVWPTEYSRMVMWLNNKEKGKRKWSCLNLDMWMEVLKKITKTSRESRCFGLNINPGYPYSKEMPPAINQDVPRYTFHKITRTEVKVRQKYSKRERRKEGGRSIHFSDRLNKTTCCANVLLLHTQSCCNRRNPQRPVRYARLLHRN
jgi:hypothetical protein